MLKIFLERQVHVLVVEARADQLGHALDHGHIRAAVGVSLGQVGLKPHAMPEQVVVSPSTGSLAAMAIVGVSWYLPP